MKRKENIRRQLLVDAQRLLAIGTSKVSEQLKLENENPAPRFRGAGLNYWRRPTFAQPRDALSSGLQRFTSVFEMGTGGATALGSPEV